MSRESTQELRQRLLGNPEVQKMIRVRAFEIYERRGRVPGKDAENWFQAEQEVLSFLIEEEDRRANEARRSGDTTATVPESEISALGAWSATEPASEELAPSIGETTGAEADVPAPKKTRARASSKSSAAKSPVTRKKKSDTTAKASAKEAAAKTTTRRASAKKTGEEAKSAKAEENP